MTVACRAIVNGEGELSAQSEVLSAFYQVFKYFALFRFPSTPTGLPVPAAASLLQHDAAIAPHLGHYCEGEEWCLVSFKQHSKMQGQYLKSSRLA